MNTNLQTAQNIQRLIDDIHRDIYTGYYAHKLTIEQLSKTMLMSPDTIKNIIATYQKKLEEGTHNV